MAGRLFIALLLSAGAIFIVVALDSMTSLEAHHVDDAGESAVIPDAPPPDASAPSLCIYAISCREPGFKTFEDTDHGRGWHTRSRGKATFGRNRTRQLTPD